jgi:hypothetical protein
MKRYCLILLLLFAAPCLGHVRKGTPVDTDKGAIPIEQLDPGQHALRHAGPDGLMTFTQNYRVFRTGRADRFVRLRIASGRFIDTTPDHRIGSEDFPEALWMYREANDFQHGTRVWHWARWNSGSIHGMENGDAHRMNSRVETVERLSESDEVWDISNAAACHLGQGNFYANGFLAHNQDPEPAVDALSMPKELRPANISSKGSGCCTFRSAEYAGQWQNEPALIGLPEWMRSKGIEGGGWPEKQADMVKRIAEDRKMPVPRFMQYTGNSAEVIEAALKSGRLPCITWGGNHMLCCVYLDDKRGAILDNNDPHRLHWYERSRFMSGFTQGGGGWVFVLLNPGPPPTPRNAAPPKVRHQSVLPKPKASYRWTEQDGELRLYDATGKHIGSHFPTGTWAGQYRRWSGQAWSEPCAPPIPVEGESAPGPKGLQWEPTGIESYSIGGEEVSRDEAMRAIIGADLDDHGHPHLTFVGAAEELGRAKADWDTNHGLAPFKTKYRVQFYTPENWAIAPAFGYKLEGFTVYEQKPSGVVDLRMRGPYAGADSLATALRKPDPNYDPNKDPDGKPKPPPPSPLIPAIPDLSGILKAPWLPWVGMILFVVLWTRKQNTPVPAK